MKVGKWYPLAERLSRWARIRLLKVALDVHMQKDIAKVCGVAPQAVSNWLKKEEYHPNDKNAAVILKTAYQIDRDRVREILKVEGERYLTELKKAGIR